METMHCVQVDVATIDEVYAALLEADFWELAPDGIERQDDETFSDLVDDPRPRPAGTTRWRLYTEGQGDIEQKRADVARLVEAYSIDAKLDAWVIDDLSFLVAWREFFKPAQISPRFIVHPPWEEAPSEWEGIRLNIEPGMAFGTGTHETTRLCLRFVDELFGDEPPPVLDVGTGSGILAIASRLAGSPEVLGTDNDPIAIEVAAENAARNGVKDGISWSLEAPTASRKTWPLVLANILPVTLNLLRDELIGAMASDGSLIVSGILVSEVERFIEDFCDGLHIVKRLDDGLWTALHLKRA